MTDRIEYLSAVEEGQYTIAQANAVVDVKGALTDDLVTCRHLNEFTLSSPDRIQYMDVSPRQIARHRQRIGCRSRQRMVSAAARRIAIVPP